MSHSRTGTIDLPVDVFAAMAALLRRAATIFVGTAAPASSTGTALERSVLDPEPRALLASWVLAVVQLAARQNLAWSAGLVGITLRDTFHIPAADYCAAVSLHRTAVSHADISLRHRGVTNEEILRKSWNELVRVCALVLDEEQSLFRAKLGHLCEATGIVVPESGGYDDAPAQDASVADTESHLDRLATWTAEFDALLARMQESGARERMQAAFDAGPEELGQAAVDAARRHG